METELKLSISPGDTRAFRDHPILKKYALEKPHEVNLSSIYFDTPRLDVKHADAGLRVRQMEDKSWIQTLKVGSEAISGLHHRQEWESTVIGPKPDLPALQQFVDPKSNDSKLIKALSKHGHLLPAFTTNVHRTVWDLRLPTGEEIECVLDQGSIDHGSAQSSVSEVELELKSGDPRRLFDLALELQNTIPLHIGNLSKADRGYGLLAPTKTSSTKATPLRLAAKMTVEQAFQAIASNCLSHIQANQAGVSRGCDVESLHQMRVGLRRFRSALGMFKNLIPCPAEIQTGLIWLDQMLGPARDWDVLTESTLPRVESKVAEKSMMVPLLVATQDKATTCHHAAAEAVLSQRYTKLMVISCGWIQCAGWRNRITDKPSRPLTRRIGRFAEQILERDQQRLIKRGKLLKGAKPEQRHGVRIAAKKTRYAAEFFESLYSAKIVRPYINALARLQDELGWLNDAAVASVLLKEIGSTRPNLRGTTGFVAGYLAHVTEANDDRLNQLWRQFARIALPGKS